MAGNAIAIGTGATVNGASSGSQGNNAIAMGFSATTTGENTIAMGMNCEG